MNVFFGQNLIEFTERFKMDQDYLDYLLELKWINGFICIKCGDKGNQEHKNKVRVCNKYLHIKGVVASVFVRKIKFGITKKTKHNYLHKVLKAIFEKDISAETNVITDKRKGYKPLSKIYDIKQVESDCRINFPILHTMIYQLKSWMGTIYYWLSDFNINRYLEGFCYGINRVQSKDYIFNNIIKRMVKADKINQFKLICNY